MIEKSDFSHDDDKESKACFEIKIIVFFNKYLDRALPYYALST